MRRRPQFCSGARCSNAVSGDRGSGSACAAGGHTVAATAKVAVAMQSRVSIASGLSPTV
ncbi:Uncharacterised protein [Mycobacteroides abscessus subsp. massiliense]|nr:Uncharacterised protein [Mycobacteroides abscessus subsp. massiliense]